MPVSDLMRRLDSCRYPSCVLKSPAVVQFNVKSRRGIGVDCKNDFLSILVISIRRLYRLEVSLTTIYHFHVHVCIASARILLLQSRLWGTEVDGKGVSKMQHAKTTINGEARILFPLQINLNPKHLTNPKTVK